MMVSTLCVIFMLSAALFLKAMSGHKFTNTYIHVKSFKGQFEQIWDTFSLQIKLSSNSSQQKNSFRLEMFKKHVTYRYVKVK